MHALILSIDNANPSLTSNIGHMDLFPVQKRAASFPGREQLLQDGIVHDAEDHLFFNG